MKKIVVAFCMLASIVVFSQNKEKNPYRDVETNKGKFFFYWGWNRANYSTSDITFEGDGYKFSLENVKADDKPKPFGIYYFKPDELTIPQTNMRFGYYFHDNYYVTLGVDHMKYVMRNNQSVNYNGNLPVGSEIYTSSGSIINLDEDFLTFEHTDGLNYVNVEINRSDVVDEWIKLKTKNIDINLIEGFGVGVLYPKTNTKLLGKERYDEFHVSGYGISGHVGLNLTFFKHFFIQSNMKFGYIKMNDIRTTASSTDSAKQDFTFFENMYVFGYKFNL
ncbi:hypothetical protein R3X25_12065 [Lutibacter sp. TH_r2]|uniref:hypothetical protein n=1 Tax=Lutibacter sp. TH_r2 TaxID=3082083 RepID=UPI00295559EA|nr:hypothetical protein [Lutibacter sp. TH_r2]MDV7188019.1 hypothetical protein [Lutibacter sp. TH_r2]